MVVLLEEKLCEIKQIDARRVNEISEDYIRCACPCGELIPKSGAYISPCGVYYLNQKHFDYHMDD